MIKDYFSIPWKEVKRKKLRSWLTLIGIFIGIAAIVSLITLGKGLENAIEDQFQALGNDKLLITAKAGGTFSMGLTTDAVKITEDDLEVVRDTDGVNLAAGMIYTNGRIEFNDLVRYNFVSGTPVEPEERALIGESQNYHLMEGRFLRKGDKYKALVGYEYSKNTMFEKELELGDKLDVQGQEFKVIGFLEKIGSPPDDSMVMIPLDTYSEVFNSGKDLGIIIAQTKSGYDPLKVAEDLEKELRNFREVEEGEEDFDIQTPEQMMESFSVILDIVQIVLIGIAAISLFVGGVGIMNTMYTSVLERTKEIGIMKAIGARNSQVLYLFLVESGLYGLGGGIIGAALGIGFAKLAELIMEIAIGPAFLSVEIEWMFVLSVLLFSFIVGCLSGIAPARKASKLNPVDSLRYE